MFVLTSDQIKKCEQSHYADINGSSDVLIQKAGSVIWDSVKDSFSRILVVAGIGNNGADGIVAATHALLSRLDPTVIQPTSSHYSAACLTALDEYLNNGGRLIRTDTVNDEVRRAFSSADLIIDGLFGIGLNKKPEGFFADLINMINESESTVLSIDIPSGLLADTETHFGLCVHADSTITFIAPKKAQYFPATAKEFGSVSLYDLDVSFDNAEIDLSNSIVVDHSFLNSIIPTRKVDTHKGTFGKALIIAGCKNYCGAPFLSASSALRSGAGLVYLCVPESLHSILAQKINECIFYPCPQDPNGMLSLKASEDIFNYMIGKDAVLIGPGLGLTKETIELVKQVIKQATSPLIIDADGLTALSSDLTVLDDNDKQIILTPHLGEMSRLSQTPIQNVSFQTAHDFAVRHKVYVLLKGYITSIHAPDGRSAVGQFGNPGMATGGSGDVLSGIIVSLLGQGLSPFNAMCAGAYIHGKAGNFAANEYGEYSMLPTDCIQMISKVLKNYNSRVW